MSEAFICDAIRTPIGKLNGALSPIRADDLAAIPMKALMQRNPEVDWAALDDVIMGAANQSGEDNRDVARMGLLLAGLPVSVPGVTVNRLCASGLNAVGMAAQAIRSGDADFVMAGGSESMTRAPYVMGKAEQAFGRAQTLQDTTMGWRFVNPALKAAYGADTMPQTAENVAQQWGISRKRQDAFALASQQKYRAAADAGLLAEEIVPVEIPRRKAKPVIFASDEHPRETTLEALAGLRPVVAPSGTVTAGNSSGINDGAAAMLVASEAAAKAHGLTPRARVVAMAAAGVEPRVMGMGPVDVAKRVLARTGLSMRDMSVIELNEAFAAQALACLDELGVAADDPRVNPYGGAIAMGHPLGMSGARLVQTATAQLVRGGGRYALAFMCVGVGQGAAMIMERV